LGEIPDYLPALLHNVVSYAHAWLGIADRAVLHLLEPLMVAILLSGLDDLAVNAVWAVHWLKRKLHPKRVLFPPGGRQLNAAPRRKIAILVPLWHEHSVIADMLQHNLASIRYADYHVFAGCYPNDDLTQEAVRSIALRFSFVHMAVCPHDGPTSKGDCLNWIFQHLLLYEEDTKERFDLVLTHDAEDMIHPDELRWINYYAGRYDFIQTPVLPIATPIWKWTHGIYCDEFAENHTVDMVVRALCGGFVPSAGVGTGYSRDAMDKLARSASNRIFEPDSLTEDYENGLRLHRLGAKQAFVPISLSGDGARDFVVTRELFPHTWSTALRQRSRWVTGIALQGWQRFGWSLRRGEFYWFWRDRKGLLGNPLSLLANLVFLYGLATSLWTRVTPEQSYLAIAMFGIQIIRTAVRTACTSRVYGFVFALGVPLRMAYGNVLNSAATFQAMRRYFAARLKREPLKWLKTEHSYPPRAALLSHKRKIGEILVGSGYLTEPALEQAISTRPSGKRIGEHLVASERLSPRDLYEALSLQHGLPLAELETHRIPTCVVRALPRDVIREFKVLPFRVSEGTLHLAGPEFPSSKLHAVLGAFTTLELKFHLLPPNEFERLTQALL
jgi:adsorption protein B